MSVVQARPISHRQVIPPTAQRPPVLTLVMIRDATGLCGMRMDIMAKKMLIDATHPEETRVVVADGAKVEEFDFESEKKRQLAGNIYLAKVTRVEPSLQAAFVDYGGNRHGFLAFSEIHPDYYQIPVADRQALIEEEIAHARAQAEEEDKPKKRGRGRSRSRASKASSEDAVVTKDVVESEINGMDVVDLEEDIDPNEAASPMETVAETPVETPAADTPIDDTDPVQAVPVDAAEAVEQAEDGDTAPEVQDGDAAPEGQGDELKGDDADPEVQESGSQDIESVAQEDDTEEVRPLRKPRPKRYKIQEVIKVRQILLVQVVKEERGNKGAALTTYLSLAGRYCVLMPNTARGGGISRKITNATDRKKLKEIADEIDVPTGAGLIVRTAGAKRTKAEIKRDYEYLQRQWEQVRELTLKSIAPAPIYEEGDLIKRSIRDLYNREIDEVLVEGEAGYKEAKAFMKMIMPSHAKNVKQYADPMPLFARHQVESYLSGMFNPTVQLPSGGYIVIGITEALVAVDVNSGRATKEGSIEQTALKTNLEAAEEVARQMRLRDLAGLIVIDFIDMEERRNNSAVEKRLKEKLKTDRARIQVGRISGFGLLEMSRQRLRPGMLEATTQPCPSCHGTGLIRSDDSLALTILRQLEEEGTRKRTREVLLRAPVAVVNYLMNTKREHIAEIEVRYSMAVRIEADPHMVSPDFTLEKFKTATRVLSHSAVKSSVVSMDSIDMSDIEEAVAEEVEAAPEPELDEDGNPKKKKRRRRRGGRGRNRNRGRDQEGSETNEEAELSPDGEASEDQTTSDDGQTVEEAGEDKPAKPKTRKGRSKTTKTSAEAPDVPEAAEGADVEAAPAEEEAPKPKSTRSRSRKKAAPKDAEAGAAADEVAEEVAEKPKKTTRRRKKADPEAEVEADVAAAPAAEDEVKAKPPKKTTRSRAKPKKVDEGGAEDVTPQTQPEVATAEPVVTPVVTEPVIEEPPKPKRTRTRTSGTTPKAEPMAAEVEVATATEEKPKPKRRGWWSLGR